MTEPPQELDGARVRSSRRLAVVVLVMTYAPVVALAVLLANAFGWRLSIAFALALGLVVYRARRAGRSHSSSGTVVGLLGTALLGAIAGGLVFGGLGVIFGFV